MPTQYTPPPMPLIEEEKNRVAPKPYADMVKDGTYQVKVPLVGHALPHIFSHEFPSKEAGEKWIESPEGRDLIKQLRDKYAPRRS